jgi:hypothetical protein
MALGGGRWLSGVFSPDPESVVADSTGDDSPRQTFPDQKVRLVPRPDTRGIVWLDTAERREIREIPVAVSRQPVTLEVVTEGLGIRLGIVVPTEIIRWHVVDNVAEFREGFRAFVTRPGLIQMHGPVPVRLT